MVEIDKHKRLGKLVVILFESKFKTTYTNDTVKIWVELMEKYENLDVLEEAVKFLIYNDDDFISIGKIEKRYNINYEKHEADRKRIQREYEDKLMGEDPKGYVAYMEKKKLDEKGAMKEAR